MDPTQTYLDMCHALNTGDLATARERAFALREWFARGGFYPQGQSPEAINATITQVLAQAEDAAVFSLTCEYCDAGLEIGSAAEAIAAGWEGIEYAPDLPTANYVGVCPDCQRQQR